MENNGHTENGQGNLTGLFWVIFRKKCTESVQQAEFSELISFSHLIR